MNTIGVNCDGCGHSRVVPFDDVPKLHNQPCPSCNASVPINDDDLAMYHLVKAGMAAGLLGCCSATTDDLPEDTVAALHIDTAPLRKAGT